MLVNDPTRTPPADFVSGLPCRKAVETSTASEARYNVGHSEHVAVATGTHQGKAFLNPIPEHFLNTVTDNLTFPTKSR